ncbi:hypothetical protein Acsp05_05060 [Actinokineospora sp. NBRC 105648]|nr:hypothetical protein Acsp05_05060 [Actinokineospora sp. NBRC 105648]
MRLRPLVALKSKTGELDALCRLPESATGPTAVVDLLDSVTAERSGRLLGPLVRAAVRLALRGTPLWVDAHRLAGSGSLARQPGGPLGFLDKRVEAAVEDEYGLFAATFTALIPVVADTASERELSEVSQLLEHRPRAVVVRVRQVDAPLLDVRRRLRGIARTAGGEAARLHAIVDLGFVDTVRQARVDQVSRLSAMLVDLLGPDSTTLLAGSIPAVRTEFATTVRDRLEVTLWQEVASRVTELHYGDYGVVHPVPPRTGEPGPRNINPYLYYTIPGRTVALRRRLARDEDNKVIKGAAIAAFNDLAEELVTRSEFAGKDYSWGDRELTNCGRGGTRTAGTVPRWVAIATSHHLEHLTRHPGEGI